MPAQSSRTPEERAIVREARKRRPFCRHCGRAMEPNYKLRDRRVEVEGGFRTVDEIIDVRGYGYASEGLFCSLRCGYEWAKRHYR